MKQHDLRSVSVSKLCSLLSSADLPSSVELLEEIQSRLDQADPDLWVALSVRLFALGDDDQALQYVSRAIAEQPNNLNALKLQIFLAAARGEDVAQPLCQELLRLHPQDKWAITISRKLADGDTGSLSLPPLRSRWEDLAINSDHEE